MDTCHRHQRHLFNTSVIFERVAVSELKLMFMVGGEKLFLNTLEFLRDANLKPCN